VAESTRFTQGGALGGIGTKMMTTMRVVPEGGAPADPGGPAAPGVPGVPGVPGAPGVPGVPGALGGEGGCREKTGVESGKACRVVVCLPILILLVPSRKLIMCCTLVDFTLEGNGSRYISGFSFRLAIKAFRLSPLSKMARKTRARTG
jgi:hypothetical protein